MKPVVTALHAIAAIERETREAHTAATSAGRSETILPQDLSESSLASGNDRHAPRRAFRVSRCDRACNRGPGIPLIDHLGSYPKGSSMCMDWKN